MSQNGLKMTQICDLKTGAKFIHPQRPDCILTLLKRENFELPVNRQNPSQIDANCALAVDEENNVHAFHILNHVEPYVVHEWSDYPGSRYRDELKSSSYVTQWPIFRSEFGVEYGLTQGNHVHLGVPSGQGVFLYGKQYFFSVHLYLVDGQWVINNPRDFYSSPDAGIRAKKKILDTLIPEWNQFINQHPELLNIAEHAHICQVLKSLDSKIEDAEKEITKQKIERVGLLKSEFDLARLVKESQ